MKTICFSSLKGGSGKSSLSFLTSQILAERGHRVLCLDLDVQNSLSWQLTKGLESLPENRNLHQALTDGDLSSHLIRNQGVSFAVSDLRLLDDAESMSFDEVGKLLQPLHEDFDFAVLDLAPTWNRLVASAWLACDALVIPVELSLFDCKSLSFLFSKLHDLGLHRLDVHIAVNKFLDAKKESSLNAEYLALLAREYGSHLLRTRIPYSSAIRSLLDTGKKLPAGKVKLALEALTDELSNETTP